MRYEPSVHNAFFMSEFANIILTPIQKRAFLKIAMELVKIDNLFHCNEVNVLSLLEKEFDIQADDVEMIHYISLSQAIAVLKQLDREIIARIVAVFENIVCTDNDIDIKENILLTAIRMSLLPEFSSWSTIISIDDANSDCSTSQLAFVEKTYDVNAHDFFDNDYERLFLENELAKAGIKLFYLPSEIKKIESFWTNVETANHNSLALRHSLQFITPIDKRVDIKDAILNFENINLTSFYNTLLLRYKIVPDKIEYNTFFLLKIKSGDLLNDFGNLYTNSDFLVISLDKDVKKRISAFLSLMVKPDLSISVDGYYKFLYEYLSEKCKMLGEMEIGKNNQLFFKNINREQVVFKSFPQSCTLYFLILKYGKSGVASNLFNDAYDFLQNIDASLYQSQGVFDMNLLLSDLENRNCKQAILLHNIIVIYSALSTKDIYSDKFLDYIKQIIKHRSSLKSYINSAFDELNEGGICDSFKINYDSEYKTYNINADISLFKKWEKESCIPLIDSDLWKRLK